MNGLGTFSDFKHFAFYCLHFPPHAILEAKDIYSSSSREDYECKIWQSKAKDVSFSFPIPSTYSPFDIPFLYQHCFNKACTCMRLLGVGVLQAYRNIPWDSL